MLPKDFKPHPIALRLNLEQWDMLKQLSTLLDAPEAVVLRMALKQMHERTCVPSKPVARGPGAPK